MRHFANIESSHKMGQVTLRVKYLGLIWRGKLSLIAGQNGFTVDLGSHYPTLEVWTEGRVSYSEVTEAENASIIFENTMATNLETRGLIVFATKMDDTCVYVTFEAAVRVRSGAVIGVKEWNEHPLPASREQKWIIQ